MLFAVSKPERLLKSEFLFAKSAAISIRLTIMLSGYSISAGNLYLLVFRLNNARADNIAGFKP